MSEPVRARMHLLDADGNQVGDDIAVTLEMRGGNLVNTAPTTMDIPPAGIAFVGWEVWTEKDGKLAGGTFA